MTATGSLRIRLLAAGGLSIVLALALAAAGLVVLFSQHVERRIDAELGLYLDQIIAGLAVDPGGTGLSLQRPLADPRFDVPLSGLYWQIEAGGQTLRSRSLWDSVLALPADELADGAVHRHVIAGPDQDALVALERRITLPGRLGGGTARVDVALTLAEVNAATRAFALDLLPYLGVLALVLLLAGYVQVTVGLRPLRRIHGRLKAIRQDPKARFGGDFPFEIRPIATEIDSLLSAREQQIDKARARAGDLAHGLKTPLQVLFGDVARLRAEGRTEIADEIDQVATTMQRHINREMAKARMAASSQRVTTPVRPVVEQVVAVVARTPAGVARTWTVDMADGLNVAVDPDDLAEALGNLVENAARHAVTAVTIAARAAGGQVTLQIGDDGPGIPEPDLGRMLERGMRLDQSAHGAGLGLAITRDMAEAWGGALLLDNTAKGFEATLTLPAAG